MSDTIELTKKLIACPSVTPKDEGALKTLGDYLEGHGFECHYLPFGEVNNLFARIGPERGDTNGPHLCYAGHTDVVPPGPEDQWTYGPFNPHIEDGVLYGRGASDMKGSVASFAAAAAEFIGKHGQPNGSISLLITGDEEGPAVDGTVKVLEWMKDNNHIPDVALVGEPTNPDHLGQEIKIGRRGSLTGSITVEGVQGHVAYPHLSKNPVPDLTKLVDVLASYEFDQGSEFFPPTNLEFVGMEAGTGADNVIPAFAKAVFNVRFNDKWSSDTLEQKIIEVLNSEKIDHKLNVRKSSESFLTQPGEWSDLVADTVEEISGKRPECTTTGGTSDARFVVDYCPVIECGPINKTIHQIDENAKVSDLEDLTKIYVRILERYFN